MTRSAAAGDKSLQTVAVASATDSSPAVLALADGRVFRGRGFGAKATTVGEVVFNTSMSGYQEIVTDPSYAGQLVCLTVSEVGNVGCNDEDIESDRAGAEGLIVRSLSPVVSNWRATESLPEFLQRRGIPGVCDIDTRALTRHLRELGSVVGTLSTERIDEDALVAMAREAPSMEGQSLVQRVTSEQPERWDEATWQTNAPAADLHVVAYDFGIKRNILRCFRDVGVTTTVVPATTRVEDVLALQPDGIFLSNGPGDPAAEATVVERVREVVEQTGDLPVFGICLGHQLLCLALGGKTYKLKFGHHGGNHPVRDEDDRSVDITAQNHGFAVDAESMGQGVRMTHLNLFDRTVAGLRLTDRPLLSVQYHPEASPGPHDAQGLFARFATLMREHKAARGAAG